MTWHSDPVLVEEWPSAWWTSAGACKGRTDLFFAPSGGEMMDVRIRRQNEAIAICDECPVLQECREYALRIRVRDGVWGGLTSGARRRILRRKAS